MDEQGSRPKAGVRIAGFAAVLIAALAAAAVVNRLSKRGDGQDTSTPTPSPATTAPSGDVGTVQTVLVDKRYASAAVGSAAEWQLNDEVEMTDAAGTVLTTGTVKMVMAKRNVVHVKFEPLPAGSGPIKSGDRVRRTGRALPPATTRP